MKEAVIVAIARTAVGKAPRGTLRNTRPDDMAAAVITEILKRVPGLDPNDVEDVILGCAMPEAEQGNNVARVASLRAGLPVSTSAMTINRFCSSGLQAIALASERIMAGMGGCIIAGGTESMSLIPMGGFHFSPNPYLMDHYPDSYLSMGLTAENLARKFGITREQADEFALRSHVQALAVIREADLDPEKTNVNGGAVALGHPLGSTGAKLTATLLGEMKRRKARYGMVTMCVGGGMGAAGIFENLQ